MPGKEKIQASPFLYDTFELYNIDIYRHYFLSNIIVKVGLQYRLLLWVVPPKDFVSFFEGTGGYFSGAI